MSRTVTFGGVTLTNAPGPADGSGIRWYLVDLLGWDDTAPVRTDAEDRPQAHGMYAGPAYRSGRVVTIEATAACQTPAHAATAKHALQAALADGLVGVLMVDDSDEGVLSAPGQVYGTPLVRQATNRRVVRAQVQVLCPEPFRYAPTVVATTGFAHRRGALRFPLFTAGAGSSRGVLTFGDPGAETGTVTMANPGTAPAWPVHTVTGPTPAEGFDVLLEGARLRYSRALGDGAVLTIDPASGSVREGAADRRRWLTVREWAPVPKQSSAEVAFVSLGGATAGSLSVALAPTYW